MTKKLQFNPDYLQTREDFIRIVNEMRDEYMKELKLNNRKWVEWLEENAHIGFFTRKAEEEWQEIKSKMEANNEG